MCLRRTTRVFLLAFSGWLSACELPGLGTPKQAEPEPSSVAEPSETEVTATPIEAPPESEPTSTEPPPQVPEVARDGVHETGEQTRGRLAPAKISPVLEAHSAQFTRCYSDALASERALSGRVTLLIVIAPDGRVPFAKVLPERTTLNHEGVQECLIREAKTLTFERPIGGRVVTEYPLEFAPADPEQSAKSLPAKATQGKEEAQGAPGEQHQELGPAVQK